MVNSPNNRFAFTKNLAAHFAQALDDSLLDQVAQLAIHGSESDSALGTSTFILESQRLGQILPDDEFSVRLSFAIATDTVRGQRAFPNAVLSAPLIVMLTALGFS